MTPPSIEAPMRSIFRTASVLLVGLLAAGSAHAREFSFNEVLKGEVQKPTIDILISRQNLSPKYVLDLKESFLPKIVDAVNSKPF